MWPVSNIEGVISACTSRLPGVPIKMRFERTVTADRNIDSVSSSSSGASAIDLNHAESIPHGSMADDDRNIMTPTIPAAVDKASQTALLKKVRDLLRRYRAVHEPLEKKSSEVLLLVTERAVETLMTASTSLDAKTLLLIMDSYTMSGKPSGAIEVFEAAVGLSSDGSSATILNAISDKKDSRNLVPKSDCLNLYTGTALLRAHALCGNYNAARRVLASIEGDQRDVNGVHSTKWPGNIKPDTNCYNTIIFAAANAGTSDALDMAKSLYDSMAEPVLFPTARPKKTLITYNTLISAYARCGRRQEAFSIFMKMKDAGINPDRVSVTSLIKAAVEDGDVRAGKALLKDMKKAGIDADVVTYNTLIKAYCDRNQLFEAKELVVEMETRGIQPDAKTYGLLMNSLLKTGKPGPCLTLFESACSDQRTVAITENVQLYTTAITAAASMGDYDRALDLISRMTFSGIKPNMKTLTALMSASLSAGKFDYALEVYGKISNPDGHAMTLALKAYCDKGEYDRVLTILRTQRSNHHEMSGKQIMSIYNYFLERTLAGANYSRAFDSMVSGFNSMHRYAVFLRTFVHNHFCVRMIF
jgi:pentatricopeptide repeat protein